MSDKGFGFLSFMTTVILFVLSFLLVGVRIFGLTPYAVVSGSMAPTYDVGSLVYVRSVPLSSIEVGMPITYLMDSSLFVVTHRVVEVDESSSLITTQGDANDVVDALRVHYFNVMGAVVGYLPYLGFVSQFIHSVWGVALLLVLMAVMILRFVVDLLVDKLKKGDLKIEEK